MSKKHKSVDPRASVRIPYQGDEEAQVNAVIRHDGYHRQKGQWYREMALSRVDCIEAKELRAWMAEAELEAGR